MSGGRFDYKDMALRDEIFGWSDRLHNVFEDREISELVWDVLNLIHEFDWYDSGDTSEKTWLDAKRKFKRKWFENRDILIHRIVDTAIDEVRDELHKTFDLKSEPKTIPHDDDKEFEL